MSPDAASSALGVQPPDHQRIARLQRGDARIQPGPAAAGPGRLVSIDGSLIVNGTERCPVFGKIRCPIFCTLRNSNLGCYPEAALPSSSFTATLSIPALRLVLSR